MVTLVLAVVRWCRAAPRGNRARIWLEIWDLSPIVEPAQPMQPVPAMDGHQPIDFDDDQSPRTPKNCDPTALRILARWIAMHDGIDSSGAMIDRDFVVLGQPPS